VLFVSSEANIQKNTLEVKVALDSPAAVLKPDMLVEVTHLAPKPVETIADASAEMRLFVPQQLILGDQDDSFVWVADRDTDSDGTTGAARKTTVTTAGVASGGLVEVTSGLTLASRIIARGHEGLSDGQRIRVVEEDAAAVTGRSDASHSAQQPLQRLPRDGE
jgi:hypothetical protein